ncbi:MAG TPA: hypothetical protein VF653_01305 [Methylomirabilota bacterium]
MLLFFERDLTMLGYLACGWRPADLAWLRQRYTYQPADLRLPIDSLWLDEV